MANTILVTTTNSLEGLTIKQYIKPLSAHVVAGTGFISDFFASFSDVFGGRSGSYQRQLSSIYSEAIESLKKSATEIGANGIIGLRVDLDEISGKGKSMFMVTATGTAVVIEQQNTVQKNMTSEKLSFITVEKMEDFRRRKEIVQLGKEKKFRKEDGSLVDDMDKIWDFVTSNAVAEVAGELLTVWDYPKLLSYFSVLDVDFSTQLLLDIIMSDVFHDKLLKLYYDLRIFDAARIAAYLLSNNEQYKRRALQLVVSDKQTYAKEDIQVLETLVQTIRSSFQEVVTISTKKGLLSKEKNVWTCTCKMVNDMDKEYCRNDGCARDRYGFLKEYINPPTAIRKLEETIKIIRENLV